MRMVRYFGVNGIEVGIDSMGCRFGLWEQPDGICRGCNNLERSEYENSENSVNCFVEKSKVNKFGAF